MCQALHIMKTLNVIGVIVAVTIIALAGIAAVASVSLLVQSASATTDVLTTTTVGGEEGVSTTTTTNNTSNATLGSLFLIVEFETTSVNPIVNPINETYIEISYVANATIMPPNATTTTTINATVTSNATVDILPNGLALDKGQSLIVTQEEEGDGAEEQENASATFVELSRARPDNTGSGTGIVFFTTNSTGQLAFLNNMLAIFQHEFSQERDTLRMWEWKGGTLPFENGSGVAPITANQTTPTSMLQEEE
jgi:hypothetical protein